MLLIPTLLGTLIFVIAHDTLFPPVPRALINICTGGLQKPQAGQPGSFNIATGAHETHQGEAVEEEAESLVANIWYLLSRAVGMHKKPGNPGDSSLEDKVPSL